MSTLKFYNGSSWDPISSPTIKNITVTKITDMENVSSQEDGYITFTKSDNTTFTFNPKKYECKGAVQNGVAWSLVTTGEKYTWNNKVDASTLDNYLKLTEANTLQKPLTVTGGDGAAVGKIILAQASSGQITDSGTSTIFGFTTNGATSLTVGHTSYSLALRGSGTRPKFNGNNLALYSDIPDVTNVAKTNTNNIFSTNQTISGTVSATSFTENGTSLSSKYLGIDNAPKAQAYVCIVANATTNLNGYAPSGYSVTDSTISGYTVKIIKYNSSKMSKSQSATYMQYMTGSTYVPEYNQSRPCNTLFIFGSDNSIWKPQYDSTNGLVLFYVNTLVMKSSLSYSNGSLTITV